MFKLRWFLPILAVALAVALVLALWPAGVQVSGQGTLSISNTMRVEAPQIDLVDISDIPAYGVIEPSGCGEFKGRVKIRIDCFMEPEAPYYNLCYVEVIDTTSEEYLKGYPGKVNEDGSPANPDQYQKWLDRLPTVWQNNPFHSHFIYYDTAVIDDTIKAKIADVTEYFYAFHTYCWDNNQTFLENWVKVPKVEGTIRDVFVDGIEIKDDCEIKSDDIVSRLTDFDTREFDEKEPTPVPLNIGEKGTIDIGAACIDRTSNVGGAWTNLSVDVPANATGTLDTFIIWFTTNGSGVVVGTFSGSGTSYTSRDSASIGDVTAGAGRTFTGKSVDVVTDDYLGIYWVGGNIEYSTSGYLGVYGKSGNQFGTGAQTYALYAGDAMSVHGTGTEAGGDPDISNAPATWEIGTVATSTDYWSSGSEPSWPLDDGECHFTVTNNGATCSMTVKGTNFTGGVGWTLAASPAENTVTMKAGKSGDANEGAFITLTTGEQSFISGLAGSGTKKWELMMESSTSHTDGAEKTGTVTLTATLD